MLLIATKPLPADVHLVRVETRWGSVVVLSPIARHQREARVIASYRASTGADATVLSGAELAAVMRDT